MTTEPKHPLMAKEFPDFDQATLPTIPAGFEDTSWHNDACPSFQHEGLGLHLFIDYADPELREMASPTRFRVDQLELVRYTNNDGDEDECWQWPEDGRETLIAEGDDWMVIFGAIREVAFKAVEAGRVEEAKGLAYEVELPAEATAKITDLASAQAWIMNMTKAHLSHHLDDSADQIIVLTLGLPLFRAEDCKAIDEQRDAAFDIEDWGVYGDPHGYCIAVQKETGQWDFWTVGDYLEFSNGQQAKVVAIDPADRKRAVLLINDSDGFMAAQTDMELQAEDSWVDLNEAHDLFTTMEEALAFLAANPAEEA